MGAGGRGHSQSKRDFIWERDKGICGICLLPIATRAEMTLDHIKPRALMGGGHVSNLRAAHFECNNRRGAPGYVPPALPHAPRMPKTRRAQRSPAHVLHHITNDNAHEFLNKLAAQKQDEERKR